MKEIRCPFCGRENTRGKYCMFCGNPLAGGKAVSEDKETAQSQRWDPETAYARSKGRLVAFAVVVVIAVVIVSVIYGTQMPALLNRNLAFSAPLGTPGATGLEEMTATLKEAGLKPVGNHYQFGDSIYQQFESSSIMGEKTSYSVAKVEKGNRIMVSHAFTEDKKKFYTINNPGPVFGRLLEQLTNEFGKPVIQGAENYYYWTRKKDILALYYGYDNVIWLSFYAETAGASV